MKTIVRISLIAVLAMMFNLSMAQIRIVAYAPSVKAVAFKNFGNSAEDISLLRYCHEFSYGDLGDLTVLVGSLTDLQPGDSVVVSRPELSESSDFGLYAATGSFNQTTSMLDFIQFGSAGNGRESVANTKGIWTTGDFLTGTETHVFTGGATDFGLSSWQVVSGINDLESATSFVVYPNPSVAGDVLKVNIPSFEESGIESVKYVNQLGVIVYQGTGLQTPEGLSAGVYSLVINTTSGNQFVSKLQVK